MESGAEAEASVVLAVSSSAAGWADSGTINDLHLAAGAKTPAYLVRNLVLMRFLIGTFHVHYLPANLIAIAACSLTNFFVSDRLVYRVE